MSVLPRLMRGGNGTLLHSTCRWAAPALPRALLPAAHCASRCAHTCSAISSWVPKVVHRYALPAQVHGSCWPRSRQTMCTAAGGQGTTDMHLPIKHGEGGEGEATCVRAIVPHVPGEAAELLCDALLGLGAQSVVVQEHRAPGAPEQEIYAEPGQEHALWDSCEVVAHFPLEHADVLGTIASAAEVCEVGVELGSVVVEGVANEAWVSQIKASYVPLRLSRRMFIVPEWDSPPAGQEADAINIILQPGVAFGTGEHPTTRMCLALLEEGEAGLAGARVMDYGTGSGVLALAALKLGAASAVGTDTDPLAVRAAARNAELNGPQCAAAFRVLQCGPSSHDPDPVAEAGLPSRGAFTLVAANILRGPLVELAGRLAHYAAPGGRLLLSGILEEQVPDVRAAYARHFHSFEVRTEGTWAAVTAVRNDA